ncbi:adhesion G-protein coupled receptor D1-like [Lineus longissimus]|uniref:adhesion G-protein coupled receptor D1-like n=1 Tax=Lineus longissimus TaxID=88925 RepID=UPI002B4FA0A0
MMYPKAADKDCTGFEDKAVAANAGYFELQKKCSGSSCSCAETFRGKECNINAVDAASFLPMEEVKDGKLVGHGFTPTVKNAVPPDTVPRFVSGKVGKAVHIKHPIFFDFGDHRSRCFGNPDKCNNGFTAAMWVYILSATDNEGYIISSGGQTYQSNVGVAVLHVKAGYVLYEVRTTSHKYTGKVNIGLLEWYHLAFTWSVQDGLEIYMNGKRVVKNTTVTTKTLVPDLHTTFSIGNANNNLFGFSKFFGKCYMDDLIVWEKRLTAQSISELYYTPNYGTTGP